MGDTTNASELPSDCSRSSVGQSSGFLSHHQDDPTSDSDACTQVDPPPNTEQTDEPDDVVALLQPRRRRPFGDAHWQEVMYRLRRRIEYRDANILDYTVIDPTYRVEKTTELRKLVVHSDRFPLAEMIVPRKRQHYIYFLLWGNEIVYVGKTMGLLPRIAQHVKDDKKFNRVLYMTVPAIFVDYAERNLIHQLQPFYNATHVARKASRDMHPCNWPGEDESA